MTSRAVLVRGLLLKQAQSLPQYIQTHVVRVTLAVGAADRFIREPGPLPGS